MAIATSRKNHGRTRLGTLTVMLTMMTVVMPVMVLAMMLAMVLATMPMMPMMMFMSMGMSRNWNCTSWDDFGRTSEGRRGASRSRSRSRSWGWRRHGVVGSIVKRQQRELICRIISQPRD